MNSNSSRWMQRLGLVSATFAVTFVAATATAHAAPPARQFEADGTKVYATKDVASEVVATGYAFGYVTAVCGDDDWTKVAFPDVAGWVPTSTLFPGEAPRWCIFPWD